MTRKDRIIMTAIAVVILLASGATLGTWWVQAHHCTGQGSIRVCGSGSYVEEPGF